MQVGREEKHLKIKSVVAASNFDKVKVILICQTPVGTTCLDCLLINNLSDVLFKFIHALILYFTFKLRYITSS